MRNVKLAATQAACSWGLNINVAAVAHLARRAAGEGTQPIVLQQLIGVPYFCQEREQEFSHSQPQRESIHAAADERICG
jgi:predicted amidohydrolase